VGREKEGGRTYGARMCLGGEEDRWSECPNDAGFAEGMKQRKSVAGVPGSWKDWKLEGNGGAQER
jgi:hypothetical protein